jgi:uncharacterized membrane protein
MVPPSEKLDRRWLVGCLVLAAALRFFHIGHQSLWIDEMISLQLATWASGAEFWRGLLKDIHGPWGSLLLHGWVELGRSEAWLRTLYAIPAIATVPLVFLLAHDLFGRSAGRVAGLAAAISPFHVWYGQEIRNYAWAMLFVTAALVLFLRLWDGRGGARTWVGLGVCLTLAALSSFAAVLLFVALAVVALSRRPFDPRFVLAGAATLAGACLVFVPWFVDWFTRLDAQRLFVSAPSPMGVTLREASGFSPFGIPYALWTFVFGYSLGPTLLDLHLDRSVASLTKHAPTLVLGGAAITIAGAFGLRAAVQRGRGAWVVGIIGIPLLLAVVLALREVKTFHPRYLVGFFPVLVAVLAAGWTRPGWATKASGVVALALAVLSLGNLYFDPDYSKDDSRAAAELLLQEERPGDSVVVIYSFRPFEHYFADTADGAARLLHVHKRFLRTDDQMRVHVADARKGGDRVWLVLSRWWDVAPEDRIVGIFEETLDEKQRWEFQGVKVLLFEGGAA